MKESVRRDSFQTPPRVNKNSVFGAQPPKTPKIRAVKLSSVPMEVFLRMRPSEEKESFIINSDDISITTAPPEKSLAYNHGDRTAQQFLFTKVFSETSTQIEVYEATTFPHVDRLFEGKNGMIVAIGCSGAGKTHTTSGTASDPGLIPLLFSDIFKQMDVILKTPGKEDVKLLLFVSMLEIHNERVYDLLDNYSVENNNNHNNNKKTERKVLNVKYDKKGRPSAQGLSEHKITSADDIKKVLAFSTNNRQVASTSVNKESSRSHSILTIKLVEVPKLDMQIIMKDPERYLKVSRLGITDLAGNERSNRTQTSGDHLKEAGNINLSLMTFSQCLKYLKSNQKKEQSSRQSFASAVVPFRDSKLTRLLQEYFLGDSRVSMIVCITPTPVCYDESINSLKLSAEAREIETVHIKPRNSIAPPSELSKSKNESEESSDNLNKSKNGRSKANNTSTVSKTNNGKQTTEVIKQQPQRVLRKRGREAEPAPDPSSKNKILAVEQEEKQKEKIIKNDKNIVTKVAPSSPIPLSVPNPSSPSKEKILYLKKKIANMKQQLKEADDRCMMVELEVREEVTEELSGVIKEMKRLYEAKLEDRIQLEEDKFNQQINVINSTFKNSEFNNDSMVVDDEDDQDRLLLSSDSEEEEIEKEVKKGNEKLSEKEEEEKINELNEKYSELSKEHDNLQVKYENLTIQLEELKNDEENRSRLIQRLTIERNSEQMEKQNLSEKITLLETKIALLEHQMSNGGREKDILIDEYSIKNQEQLSQNGELVEQLQASVQQNLVLVSRVEELKQMIATLTSQQPVQITAKQPTLPNHNNRIEKDLLSPKRLAKLNHPVSFSVQEDSHIQNQKISTTTQYEGTITPSLTGNGITCVISEYSTISTSEALSSPSLKKTNEKKGRGRGQAANPLAISSTNRRNEFTEEDVDRTGTDGFECTDSTRLSMSDLASSGYKMIPSHVPTPRGETNIVVSPTVVENMECEEVVLEWNGSDSNLRRGEKKSPVKETKKRTAGRKMPTKLKLSAIEKSVFLSSPTKRDENADNFVDVPLNDVVEKEKKKKKATSKDKQLTKESPQRLMSPFKLKRNPARSARTKKQ